eukprot:633216-Prymnesium_polylepis.1
MVRTLAMSMVRTSQWRSLVLPAISTTNAVTRRSMAASASESSKRFSVSETQAIAQAVRAIDGMAPRVVIHIENISFAGVRLQSTPMHRWWDSAAVKIKCYTHVDKISDAALETLLASEELAHPQVAKFALSLHGADKMAAKELREVKSAVCQAVQL